MQRKVTISILGRAGNGRVALQIILEKLNDIEAAIEFCRETGDQGLWMKLIEQAENKPGRDRTEARSSGESELADCRFHPRAIESRWQ